jgi:hypothetical protein
LKQLECDLILSPMKTRSRGNVRSTRGINRWTRVWICMMLTIAVVEDMAVYVLP